MRIPGEGLFPETETAERDDSPLGAFLRMKKSRLDHSALVQAQNEYAVRMDAWTDEAETGRAGGKAADVTRDCVAFHTRTVDEVMEAVVMGPAAKEAFRAWAKGRGKAACLRMAAFEDAQRHRHALEQHEIRRGSLFLAARKEPEQFEDLCNQLGEVHTLSTGQGLFSVEEAQERFALDAAALRDVVFESLYARDPEKAVAVMEDLGFDPARRRLGRQRLEGDRRAAVLRDAAARKDAARVLAESVADAVRAASLTGEGTELRELARRFMEAGDEETAGNMVRQAEFFESHAAVIKESAALDMPVLLAKIMGLEKAANQGGSAKLRESIGTELGLQAAVYAQREAALAADPAAAVDADIARDTEEETAAYRLAAQERNGVPEEARRVLTNEETAFLVDLAGKLMRAGEDEQAAALREFRGRFGRYADRALAELAAAMRPAPEEPDRMEPPGDGREQDGGSGGFRPTPEQTGAM